MNIESLREYCLSKLETTEEFPFDEDTLVFKVCGRIFALTSLSDPASVNLKCDPEYAVELRVRHEEVIAGWHMNKKHWNTVSMLGHLSDPFFKALIDHSYDCVVLKLKKADRERILGKSG